MSESRRHFVPRAAILALLLAIAAPAAAQQAGAFTVVEAVRAAMTEPADLKLIEEQLARSQAGLLVAAAPFDTVYEWGVDRLRDVTPLTVGGDALTNVTTLRVGAARQLRNGLVIAPQIGVQQRNVSVDPLVPNRASLAVTVTQPLMRGRGPEVVTAGERAARYDVSATTLDLRHGVQASAFRALASYWNYVAASRNLIIVRDTEARARSLVDQIQALIAGGNRPASEIKQVQANLSDRVALRLSFEHNLIQARQALGLAMGIPTDAIAALPLPTDDFPPIPEALPALPEPALRASAFRLRSDLGASRDRTEQVRSLIVAARDALEPRLDLQVGVGYAGLGVGRSFGSLFTPFERSASGPNLNVSFVYDWSVRNAAARGTLAQQDAIHRQTQIQTAELQRTIASSVVVARDALGRNVERVRITREAAAIYRSAVEDEREKLQLGLGTIIDLVLTEDRLTRSMLDQVSAELSYALAVARLRYETGTLVTGELDPAGVTRDQLTTVPAIAQ
jgi:outer membrane protein TolC